MKRFSLKFLAGLLTLIVGVFVVWAGGIVQMLFPQDTQTPISAKVNEKVLASPPANGESGKIVLRFKGFELGKDWIANFEIVNFTAKPITYVGFESKGIFDFCTLAAQRDSIFEPTGVKVSHSGTKTKYNCVHSTAVILQTLQPNETVVFSVFKHEVQDLVNIRELKSAHIGFEFFVGDEKRRTMLWSDEITYPEDEF